MSFSPQAYTYTGAWINWSRGFVRGATMTLTQREGGLLIAFLGIFVTFTGAATWRIMSYAIHQARAKTGPRTALYHQQQVVLRDNSTSGVAVWEFCRLFWAWRKLATRPFVRSLPLVLLAFCNMILFTLAGVFSSEVTKAAGNETLIISPGCGYQLSNLSSLQSLYAVDTNGTLAASTYANACYGGSYSVQCNQYVKPHLNWTTERSVDCPFEPSLCIGGSKSAYKMDSGLLDSHGDLGINTPDSQRLQFRKVTTCAVVNGSAHSALVNRTQSDGSNRLFAEYYFGGNGSANDPLFIYNTEDSSGSSSYALTPFLFPARGPNDPPRTEIPIQAINRTDADVVIMFLAQNSVEYTAPVEDPWFLANESTTDPSRGELFTPFYVVRPLACTDQFQFCNPYRKICTPLTGSFLVNNDLSALRLTKMQEAIFVDLNYAMYLLGTYYAVHSRGAAALRASETLQGTDFINGGMPPDQWIKEVDHWFAVNMARLQQLIVGYATGPEFLQPDSKFVPGDKDLCHRQKVRSTGGYISFSTLGVAIILIVGAVLILSAWYVDLVVGAGMRRFGWRDHKRRQWAADEKLQLLRLAYEGNGQGAWLGEAETVPVTGKDQTLEDMEVCSDRRKSSHGSANGLAHGTPNLLVAGDTDQQRQEQRLLSSEGKGSSGQTGPASLYE